MAFLKHLKSYDHEENTRWICSIAFKDGNIYRPYMLKKPDGSMSKPSDDDLRGNIYDSSTFKKTDYWGGWLHKQEA